MVGLVQKGQVDLGQVEPVDVEAAVGRSVLVEPPAHRQADAAGPGAGDDDPQIWHQVLLSPSSGHQFVLGIITFLWLWAALLPISGGGSGLGTATGLISPAGLGK